MGKVGAMEDVPQKIEKKNKSKSKKREKNEESAMKETEFMQRSENEDIAEMKKHRKRDKEKKKNKGTRDTEEVNVEKKHAKESNEDGTDKVERKRKKRDKKIKIESSKEAKKEKAMRYLKDGDIEKVGKKEEGKVVRAHSENNEVEKKKRRREKKRSKNGSEKVLEASNADHNEDFAERTERKNKKNKKKRTREENIEGYVQPNEYDENASEKHERKKKEKKYKNNEDYKIDSSATQEDISMKDSVGNDSNGVEHADKGKKKKKTKLVDNDSATPNKSNKKVRFSGEDEVFTLPDDSNNIAGVYGEDGLLRGRRFTPEEDEIVKEAVFKYIQENGLGHEGLNMVLNCQKCKLKGCWIKIGSAIPYRPCKAVYNRAQNILRRSEKRKWTQEEYEQIINYQEKHGNRWKALADELGKNYWHVRDAWCRIKLKDRKKGRWSQNEYQKLYDLVNNDLKLKVSKEKKSMHGMLRDNICWEAISDALSTRTNPSCCHKWYDQLTSRMVVEGVWADTDDYRLIGALYDLDATCIEDVDWDDLIENRSGYLCHKRWRQMVSHIGHHRNNSFAEQVELLSKRYCPHLLEAREIWDSKPRVP